MFFKNYYFLIFGTILYNLFFVSEAKSDLARGFGDDINWLRFDEALNFASKHKKPVFLLIHKSWCGACKNLKSVLSDSAKFKEMSEHFLMVNLEDDEEPRDNVYSPDGGYIPRILFIGSDGNVHSEIINELGNPKYKYYYSSADQLIASMEKALQILGSGQKIENNNEQPEKVFVNEDL